MQDKQKVTLYLPPEIHRQLKIRAAVDAQPMSEIAERAIGFYLDHADVVEEVEASAYGATHRVYNCPDCQGSVVLHDGELVALGHSSGLLVEDGELSLQPVAEERIPAGV